MSAIRYIAPRGNMPRPPLPLEHTNPKLQRLDASTALPVKFQEISREGHTALVGRMKIPTPTGHAFILRRLDTNAISLTTMFRAAFPAASEDAEKVELAWIKNSYDLTGANKSGRARFAGTWATVEVALAIADTYSISHLLPPLIEAVPDPAQTYSKEKRKSIAQPLTPQPTPPSPAKSTGPNKRRKESSPQLPPRSSPAPIVSPRRSTRLKSPAPAAVPLPLSPRRTPKPFRTRHDELTMRTPRNVNAVDEEAETLLATELNMIEDIQEQRDLIESLKSQQAARDQDENMEKPSALKRTIADVEPPLQLDVKEPETEVRAVATNKRVRLMQNMAPERKSLAWGVAAFAAGVGAILLPNWWL